MTAWLLAISAPDPKILLWRWFVYAVNEFKAYVCAAMLARWKRVKPSEHYVMWFAMRLVQDFINPRCQYLFPRLVQLLGGIESHEPFRVA